MGFERTSPSDEWSMRQGGVERNNSMYHEAAPFGRGRAVIYAVLLIGGLLLLHEWGSSGNSSASGGGGNWHPQSQQQRLEEYDAWRSGFIAADPDYQDFCSRVLAGERITGQGAQYSQDMFVFLNIFRKWAYASQKGFFVESGANDPLQYSTSLFFEKCLGWTGLCIEPQPRYHEAIKEKRSCILVPECISSKKETLKMSTKGAMAAIDDEGDLTVPCAPISDLLDRYTNGTQQHIDLWILDVEGAELHILKATDFNTVRVDAMIIEDFWLQPAPHMLDIIMGEANFEKFHQMAIDSVFVRRGTPAALSSEPYWYTAQWKEDVQKNVDYVKKPAAQAALRKAWGYS